ncbi:MAG: SDR family NAD(P)-dependent oxidoreductase, partial [Acidimicrobiaceae bacterium]|nr:SDR family NAD(P)-dependent oxidoreductase [Acidimicrobiaceae bacterium]
MVGVFGAESTTDEVLEGVDLSGRIVAITGASSGLGEESARAMSARGARVLMLARDREKNAEAAARIRGSVPGADLTLYTVDLADLASIESFVNAVGADIDRIDVLLNNAGIMSCPEGRTADGFETQFGTNHLGHFALTARLMPLLLAADRPRVVTLSSGGHRISDVALDDPNFERADYDPWIAYGRSKSA